MSSGTAVFLAARKRALDELNQENQEKILKAVESLSRRANKLERLLRASNSPDEFIIGEYAKAFAKLEYSLSDLFREASLQTNGAVRPFDKSKTGVLLSCEPQHGTESGRD